MSHTVPAFKGLPREIGYEHRLSQILEKNATREAQRTHDGQILWEITGWTCSSDGLANIGKYTLRCETPRIEVKISLKDFDSTPVSSLNTETMYSRTCYISGACTPHICWMAGWLGVGWMDRWHQGASLKRALADLRTRRPRIKSWLCDSG